MSNRWIPLWIILLASQVWADSVVVFNEIMYHPHSDDETEWIELHNQMGVDIDLSGWSLQDGVEFVIPAETIIPAGGYVLIASDVSALANQVPRDVALLGPFSGKLSNGGESILLVNNGGRLLNELDYDDKGPWPIAPDGTGVSLAKIDENTATDEPSNWTWSQQLGGTAGTQNFSDNCLPDRSVRFNEIAAADSDPFFIELTNCSCETQSLENLTLEIQGTTSTSYVISASNLDSHALTLVPVDDWAVLPIQDDVLLLWSQDSELLDVITVEDRCRGRKDLGDWMYPATPTPGHDNAFDLNEDIVINEIMYHALQQSVDSLGVDEDSLTWVELYHRGDATVDLTGWSFDRGIDFDFPTGTMIEPGDYLIVAKDSTYLSQQYPDLRILGDFGGRLSHSGEMLRLMDAYDNPVDIVHYCEGGSWPEVADGGGASLELIDPHANNEQGQAWAASNELNQTQWHSYQYRTVAATSSVGTDSLYRELIMGLLYAGEILIDDLEVIEDPNGTALSFLQNGDFETGADHWRLIGNHSTSEIINDPEDPDNQVLRLIATGPTEHMSNHAETTLANNERIANGRTYEIRFRARWIAGCPQLHTRFYFNRCPYVTQIVVPTWVGTPGRINSCYQGNMGPTFCDLTHSPAVPSSGESVTVSVQADDPDGLDALTLWYRKDETAWQSSSMSLDGEGRYQGQIPGYSTNTIVQFYIEGQDELGAISTCPSMGSNSYAQYQVPGLSPRHTGVHNYRLIMRNEQQSKLYALTNLMSNERLGATLIVNEEDIYYNVGVRLKASEHGRPKTNRVGYSVSFPADHLFRGVHDKIAFDRSNGQDVGQREMLFNTAMNRVGRITKYHDLGYLLPPNPDHRSGVEVQLARYDSLYTQECFGSVGGDGTLFEYELIYLLSQTVGNDPEGLKYPQEASDVVGIPIDTYVGENKEDYRWHFLIKNNRVQDHYVRMIDLVDVLSTASSGYDTALTDVIDLDQWMWAFGVGASWGIGDNWLYNSNHNAMFYHRPTDDKVLFFPHDLDYIYQYRADLKRNEILQMITENPHWDHLFYGYVYDFIQTSLNPDYLDYWVDHYSDLLPEQDWSTWLVYVERRYNYLNEYLTELIRNGGPDRVVFKIQSQDLSLDSSLSAMLEGNGWFNVHHMECRETNALLNPIWDDLIDWRAPFTATQGPGIYTLDAYDSQNNLVGNDTVTLEP